VGISGYGVASPQEAVDLAGVLIAGRQPSPGQLTAMPISDPAALLVGILEMGLVVVLLPWMTYIWWRGEGETGCCNCWSS
jgi:hypothetical protein